MSASQFLSMLRARWWVALLVLLIAVGATTAVTLRMPKQFAASATIVLDLKPDPIAGAIYGGLQSSTYVATQVDIILSDRVAQRVVRNLNLVQNPQVRAQWMDATQGQTELEAWLGESFQKNLDVRPSRESNVITVTYRAPDPKFAAALANAFVQSYLETALELRVDPAKQYSAFFDQRSKEARESLEKAQARLSEYQREKGIIATDERLDVENARLAELSSQLVALQALSSESGSRQAQALRGSGDRMQEVLNNSLIASLKADVSRTDARLQELNSRLGDNHPQVAETRASLASLRERLEAETRRVTGGVSITATINRQREAEVRASLESQRNKVLRMKAVRDEGSVLLRDVESAQRGYDAVLARLTQTSLESRSTQGSAYVLTEAHPPNQPSSPRVFTNILMSFVVGLFLAIAAAIGFELVDRRVRVVDDLAGSLDLPLIGVLPKPTAKRMLGRRRLSLMQKRLVSSLPAPQRG